MSSFKGQVWVNRSSLGTWAVELSTRHIKQESYRVIPLSPKQSGSGRTSLPLTLSSLPSRMESRVSWRSYWKQSGTKECEGGLRNPSCCSKLGQPGPWDPWPPMPLFLQAQEKAHDFPSMPLGFQDSPSAWLTLPILPTSISQIKSLNRFRDHEFQPLLPIHQSPLQYRQERSPLTWSLLGVGFLQYPEERNVLRLARENEWFLFVSN